MFGFQEFVILILVLAVVLVAMGVKSVPQGTRVYRRAFRALHQDTAGPDST